MQLSTEVRAKLATNFAKCVQGYHLVNKEPIKESRWEEINATMLHASGCDVHTQSNGSHASGMDLACTLGSFSNKSTVYKRGHTDFDVSSYRLTSVCSDKTPGSIESIHAEINRRKNFDFYSIIVRSKCDDDRIQYDWYLIPSNCSVFNPSAYVWHPTLGKTGKSKDLVIGWSTDVLNGSNMSITFSMSSQLWINVHASEEIKQYIVGSCVAQCSPKYNYIELHDKESM